MKSIYDLKLHEEIKIKTVINEYIVLRVPGGLVYTINIRHISTCFVPVDESMFNK